jgi:type IV pilus assembly protein PilM
LIQQSAASPAGGLPSSSPFEETDTAYPSPDQIDPETLSASEEQFKELLEWLDLEEAPPAPELAESASQLEPEVAPETDDLFAGLTPELSELSDLALAEVEPETSVREPSFLEAESGAFVEETLEDVFPPGEAESIIEEKPSPSDRQTETKITDLQAGQPLTKEAQSKDESRRALDDLLAALETLPEAEELGATHAATAPSESGVESAQPHGLGEPSAPVRDAVAEGREPGSVVGMPPEIGLEEVAQRFEAAWADEEASSAVENTMEVVLERSLMRASILHQFGFREVDRRLGVEIGSSEVTFVSLVRTGRRFELEAYGILPFRQMGEGGEASETLSRTLRELLQEKAFRQATVEVTSQLMEMTARILELPKLPRKETLRAIAWALRKDLPFPAENGEYAYRVVDDSQPKKQSLLVVGAERDGLLKYAQLFQTAGVRPTGIYSPSVALFELFRRTKAHNPETCHVLVHVGMLRSQILFVHGGRLAFERTISVALDDFLSALTDTLFYDGQSRSLSQREAFWILQRYGVAGFGVGETTSDGVPLNDIAISVRPVLEKFASEIARSLDYFRQKFGVSSFEKIWICGIGSTVLNLGKPLEAETGIPTACLNPFDPGLGLPIQASLDGLEAYGPSLVVPLGLALGPAKDLNLLPRPLRQSSAIRYAQKSLAYGAVFGLLAIGLLTGQAIYSERIERNELAVLQDQYQSLVHHQSELQRLQQAWTQLEREMKELREALPQDPLVPFYLHVLSKLTPAQIALTAVELVDRKEAVEQMRQTVSDQALAFVRLRGIVFPDPPNEGTHLAHFLIVLRTSGLFANVRMEESRTSDNPRVGVEFSIVAEIPGGTAP